MCADRPFGCLRKQDLGRIERPRGCVLTGIHISRLNLKAAAVALARREKQLNDAVRRGGAAHKELSVVQIRDDEGRRLRGC